MFGGVNAAAEPAKSANPVRSDAPEPDQGLDTLPMTNRTRLRRKPARGSFEASVIHRILDEGYICHVGVSDETGPRVIPTAYGRVGDILYIHGSTGSTMLRLLASQQPACVTVTLVDGLVLARAQRTHSLNYRSVMIYDIPRLVTGTEEKLAALAAIVDHVTPGRSAQVRPPDRRELAETHVLAISVTEASAKIRSGPPLDDPVDLTWRAWAGELPIRTIVGSPVPDPATPRDQVIEPPAHVRSYQR